jgi:hypothetical protein
MNPAYIGKRCGTGREIRVGIRDAGDLVTFQNPIPNMFWTGMAKFSWV